MKTGVRVLALLTALAGAVMTTNPTVTIADTSLDLHLVQEAWEEAGGDRDEASLVYESAEPPFPSQVNVLNAAPGLSFLTVSEPQPSSDLTELTPLSSTLDYLLAASFDPAYAGSGKIWAISASPPSEKHVLLAGLAQDVGLCFDPAHDYLYVYDRKEDGFSRICQYKTTRSEERFSIPTPEYVVVYEGYTVSSCVVDSFGNLYFSVADSDVSLIAFVNYLDLWSGQKNEFVTLYSGPDELVSSPVDLAVSPDLYLFWVNGSHEVVRAPGRYVLGRPPEVISSSSATTLSIAVSEKAVFQASADGAISMLNATTGTQTVTVEEDVGVPRAMCSAAEQIYIADIASGEVLAWSSDGRAATMMAVVAGLSDVACVTAWGVLGAVCSGVLLLA